MFLYRVYLVGLLFISLHSSAFAVILFGNQANTTDPGTGVPWKNVAAIGTNNASAVYLGNRFVLTANHVALKNFSQNPPPDYPVIINGTAYIQDSTFDPLQIGTADLKIFRITNAPAPAENISSVLLAGVLDDESLDGIFIGYGKGKGDVVAGGWAWESDLNWAANFVKRWGANRQQYTYSQDGVDYLVTEFNDNGDPNEAGIALGDSGSGFFVNYGASWKLVGVSASVTSFGQTRYDNDPGAAGDQPDNDFSVRVSHYSLQMRFVNWAEYFLGTSTPVAEDDTEGDGLSLLLEYAFGGTPAGSDATRRPQFTTDGTNASLTYYQRMSATDLTFTVQESDDLVNWQDAPSPTRQVLSSTGLVWQIKSSVPLSSASQKFLRLKVALTP